MAQERPNGQEVAGEPGSSVQSPESRLRAVTGWGAYLTVLGLAAWGGIDVIGRVKDRFFSSSGSVLERPQTPQFVYREDQRIVPDDNDLRESIRSSLYAYTQWEGFGRRNLQRLLTEEQPQETAKLIEEIGRTFVFSGVNFLRTAWLVGYVQDQATVDFAGEFLWINDWHFDLKDRFQRQLAGAWIQTKVTQVEKRLSIDLKQEDEDVEELPLEALDLGEELGVLGWLKERNLNIAMDEETFAFFPRDEMVAMARVFMAVDRLGLDLPRYVDWCVLDCLSKIPGKKVTVNEDGTLKVERKGRAGGIPTPDDGIRLRNGNLTASLAHEIGHLVSDKSNYLQRFIQVRGHEGVAPHISERWKYISLYAMADKQEDFADTFTFYMMDGERFRATLAELKVRDPGSWQVLAAKYDFMKDEVWQGLEFAKAGRIRNPGMEAREQEFTGISWNIESRSIMIKPTPEAWPEKRRIFKNFPILVDGEMGNVSVEFRYNPLRRSYEVYVSPVGLVSKISLRPVVGDDRIAVGIGSYDSGLTKLVERGTQELFEIGSGLSNFTVAWRFRVEGFSPIASGQNREIFDNERVWSDRTPALRQNPHFSTGEDPKVVHGDTVEVIDGPLLIHDGYTDTDEIFWRVRDEKRQIAGWVSQRWIGREGKDQVE